MGLFQDFADFATRSDRPAQSTQIGDMERSRDAYDQYNSGDTFDMEPPEQFDYQTINLGEEGGSTQRNAADDLSPLIKAVEWAIDHPLIVVGGAVTLYILPTVGSALQVLANLTGE